MKIQDILTCSSKGDFVIQGTESIYDIEIVRASSIENATTGSISWMGKKHDFQKIINSKASIIICEEFFDISSQSINKTLIITDKPRLLFLRILNKFFKRELQPLIHPSAVIYPWVKCGNNVRIHAGTVIGGDGFGYSRNEAGEMEKFPQLGGVVIGDNVEIGANTCIDRGTLDDTIIESGCKIDNLVHIAHNCHIKKNCVIIAHAMIGGSTVIEEGSWVAPSAAIMNGITIGKGATIGLGAVVLKSVPAGETIVGNPGRSLVKRTPEEFEL